jgi:hypothetical protein
MTSLAQPQLTFNFEPSLPERFKTLRGYIAFRVQEQRLHAATLAGKMDLSPSVLSRKLNQPDGDTQRFNVDDLEAYIDATNDVSSVIEYLAAKYMDSDKARKERVLSKVEQLLPDLLAAIASLKEPS